MKIYRLPLLLSCLVPLPAQALPDVPAYVSSSYEYVASTATNNPNSSKTLAVAFSLFVVYKTYQAYAYRAFYASEAEKHRQWYKKHPYVSYLPAWMVPSCYGVDEEEEQEQSSSLFTLPRVVMFSSIVVLGFGFFFFRAPLVSSLKALKFRSKFRFSRDAIGLSRKPNTYAGRKKNGKPNLLGADNAPSIGPTTGTELTTFRGSSSLSADEPVLEEAVVKTSEPVRECFPGYPTPEKEQAGYLRNLARIDDPNTSDRNRGASSRKIVRIEDFRREQGLDPKTGKPNAKKHKMQQSMSFVPVGDIDEDDVGAVVENQAPASLERLLSQPSHQDRDYYGDFTTLEEEQNRYLDYRMIARDTSKLSSAREQAQTRFKLIEKFREERNVDPKTGKSFDVADGSSLP